MVDLKPSAPGAQHRTRPVLVRDQTRHAPMRPQSNTLGGGNGHRPTGAVVDEMDAPKNPWSQTAHGLRFDLIEPHPDMVSIGDIAWHLARLCRFGGALKPGIPHYSVAQHSCMVSAALAQADMALGSGTEMQLAGLLHDGHEAYIGDWPTPLKRALVKTGVVNDFAWKGWLANIDAAIGSALGCNPALFGHVQIKRADMEALATERRDLLKYVKWPLEPDLPEPWYATITPWTQPQAAEYFLARYHELTQSAPKTGA